MLDKTQTTAKQIVSLLKDLEGYFNDEQNQLKEEIDGLEVRRTKVNEIKKIIDDTMIADPITLNIGGKKFQTSKATLTRIKGTYFDVMLSGEVNIKPIADTTNTFFIDRDGSNFKYILNYLRDGDINVIPKEVKSEVEREMKFYKIDLPLPPIPPSPSTLIEESHFELINNWIGIKHSFALLYKGSRDGFEASNFHQKCDGKGKTITLIKSGDGNIFGGYNSQSWNSNGQYYGDGSCFLFTIINKQEGLASTKFPAHFGFQNIQGSAQAGPIFGTNDIIISGNPTTLSNMIGFPRNYSDTTGLGYRAFTSTTTFKVEEIEVFVATHINK
ncbi:hypothetical protein DFA_06995 [Cavenderia fasciculata]|uniref:TLDc domain-containing protein n=1 Tax=Cavenderia fasciculata TaxID=261658 RepID=F4PX88_CACFS|nr:uncharacterized protein DFA_06995 [Cavenderia fasciculata]EGG19891.1 hypothetical protein DFA_06995 [Cavenderia fasciculata]|eukprot:XP_004366874.1 hypothetical protein DFA_06995 [Cavenderia fasciculata]